MDVRAWNGLLAELIGLALFFLLIVVSAPFGGFGTVELYLVLLVSGAGSYASYRLRHRRLGNKGDK